VVSGLAAIRLGNIAKVVGRVRRAKSMSRTDLAALTGLTRPTITAVVNQLLDDGVLVEVGSGSSGARGGRPGRLLAFNPAHTCVAFARIRPGRVEARIADADGRVLLGEVHEVDLPDDELFAHLAELVQTLVGRAESGPLGGVSIVLPGDLDERQGTCDFPPIGWDHLPVVSMLEPRLGVPLRLISPPRATAIACIEEGLCPDGRGLVVFYDVGLAVSVVEDWRPIAPSLGGGELGHFTMPGGTRPCVCGRVGCLGTVAGGASIARELTARGREQYASATLRELGELGELGDPVVDGVLSEAAVALGTGISWLLNAVGARPVIIGGTPMAAGADRFLAAVQDAIRAGVPPRLAEQVSVVGCPPDSTVWGAINAALGLLPAHLRALRSATQH
jgi:predicted NBD/HSP70 family sugar kinase